MAEDTKITFRLPVALAVRFRIVALEQRKPVSGILREFIEWYVEKKETERV